MPEATTRSWSWTTAIDSLQSCQSRRRPSPEFQTVTGTQQELMVIGENHESIYLPLIQRFNGGHDERTIDVRYGVKVGPHGIGLQHHTDFDYEHRALRVRIAEDVCQLLGQWVKLRPAYGADALQ